MFLCFIFCYCALYLNKHLRVDLVGVDLVRVDLVKVDLVRVDHLGIDFMGIDLVAPNLRFVKYVHHSQNPNQHNKTY